MTENNVVGRDNITKKNTTEVKQQGDGNEYVGRNKTDQSINIHKGNGDIVTGGVKTVIEKQMVYNGISLEQYEKGLKQKAEEVSKKLEKEHVENTKQLIVERDVIQKKLTDLEKSYNEYVSSVKERATTLESGSDVLLKQAGTDLLNGNIKKAKRIFLSVEENAKSSIESAGEAVYQLGKLAEDNIDYSKAFSFFKRAVELVPENTSYLSSAGRMADTLAQYNLAISYYEQALASDLKTYGEDHPSVAIYRNNLGLAWKALGKYDVAIKYYEQALASDLKTYGEDHPDVAIDRNNLGGAWYSLGKYDVAIKYYEQ
ncbi:MAG: tetratricopeptide repeat protein, partial [Gammaproteobacteria bacterium]|nr:tetratricopeptide repeat protein [Gammaproteobacteria bacterium]